MSIFSSRLKRLREARDMTQEQLATATGINRSCIARYETKEMGITAENAVKLAEALNCTTDELLRKEESA